MVAEFKRQLDSFRQDFVEAIEMAQASSAVEAMRSIGTTQWTPGPEHSWDPRDGPGLIRHINPSHPFIRDEVDRVRRMIGKGFVSAGRAEALDICVYLYNELKRHHIVYELEPQTLASGTQAIRTVTEILGGKAATCIDLACLFAALLKAAAQRPVLAVFEVKEYVHALAGYRAPNSILWDQQPSLGDLRAAVAPEDLILFEATGAAESDQVVAFETVQERCNGEKMLDFLTAKDAATRLIKSDVRLRYVVDVV